MVKTEKQRQIEYGEKQERIYEKYHKKIVKAREAHSKTRIKVIHCESQYEQARKEAMDKFWAAKKKRIAKRKKK